MGFEIDYTPRTGGRFPVQIRGMELSEWEYGENKAGGPWKKTGPEVDFKGLEKTQQYGWSFYDDDGKLTHGSDFGQFMDHLERCGVRDFLGMSESTKIDSEDFIGLNLIGAYVYIGEDDFRRSKFMPIAILKEFDGEVFQEIPEDELEFFGDSGTSKDVEEDVGNSDETNDELIKFVRGQFGGDTFSEQDLGSALVENDKIILVDAFKEQKDSGIFDVGKIGDKTLYSLKE